jgi:hypothetical protein
MGCVLSKIEQTIAHPAGVLDLGELHALTLQAFRFDAIQD